MVSRGMTADFAIVLVAAGSSTRMGFPKLWADVCGQPLLGHALACARAAEPSEVIVVASAESSALVWLFRVN